MLPILFDHLWQSTLFAALAALLTLALRKNHARVRHAVWLAASCKFLVPVSVLIALGGQIAWRSAAIPTPSKISITMDEVSQPFTTPVFVATETQPSANPLPPILFGIWLCGFIGIAATWLIRWRRIRTTVRTAPSANLDLPIEAKYSPTLIEPGVFGIFRPTLLLPEGIAGRLTPAQLDAVIAHELCHIRHRDNLTAAIQMFIETIFWFHPLVWWIGKRMVAEREQACDEEVLRLGSDPHIYAESILNICKLYTESPLACVPGITGANLKKRIQTILAGRATGDLSLAKKAALAFAGVVAFATPVVVGMMNAPALQAQPTAAATPKFEAASIKPTPEQGPDIKEGPGDNVRMLPGGRLVARKALLRYLIQNAYGVKPFQISGGPAWIDSSRYDVEAKAEGSPNDSQMRLMLQALLHDRFKLKLHRETKQLRVLELTLATSGVKLEASKQGSCISADPNAPLTPVPGQPIPCGRVLIMMSPSGVRMQGGKVSMTEFVKALSSVLGQTVIDKTAFPGTFDVHLEFMPDTVAGLPGQPPAPSQGNSIKPPPSSDQATVFAAIQEQLGLKLKSAKGPVEVLIVDRAEKPSAN